MKNTIFVSAGAGSGKTYRLTQDIAQMIESGKCRAEEIILTTFTDAAAHELREKVRSTLYAKGLYEAAINIDNAAIGTIHSIAYQIVSRYWYLLGISANAAILDAEGSNLCISQSLSSLPSDEELFTFDEVRKACNITISEGKSTKPDFGFWKRELKALIDKTVELCITEEQLKDAREKSKEVIGKVIGFCDIYNIDNEKVNTLIDIATKLQKEKLAQAVTEGINKSLPTIKKYDGKSGLPLATILGLAETIGGIKTPKIVKDNNYVSDLAFAADLAEQVPHSMQAKNLIFNYIDTIFGLAIRWKQEYEQFKRERCLLDFGDLLLKFDELLNKEEVVADIRSRYKVAFVDEFQDCSPLQVRSFERLSELMERSVWVGDIKQAIYGFRGTNTELVNAIIEKVKGGNDGNKLESLPCCWRSNATIVGLVNNIFCDRVFTTLDRKLVKLDMPERTADMPAAPRERELRHMHFVCGQRKIIPEALVEQVKELIDSGTYKASEIAILYRYNADVRACAKALQACGIPYNIRTDSTDNEGADATTDTISSFIGAVVSFAARADNELSKAIIVNSIEQGYDAARIVSERLRYTAEEHNEQGWLAEQDIIGRFAQIRKAIGNQSVGAAIETLIVELNLCDLIKRIDPAAPAHNYCAALAAKAAAYESTCANFGRSCTLVGFVDELKNNPIGYPGDDSGVSVMTYHKSKGLEWPCVILCSLNRLPCEPEKAFFGVVTLNTATETALRFIPGALKNLCKNMLAQFEDNEFFQGLRNAAVEEAKRLMYVGMTRPKEQLILTTYGPKSGDDWLTAIGCEGIDAHADTEVIRWGEHDWRHKCITYTAPTEADNGTAEPVETVVAPEPVEFDTLKQPAERREFAEKFISPSKVKPAEGAYKVTQAGRFADRLAISATDGEDSTIGNFIHHAICLWSGDSGVIKRLADEYGVHTDSKSAAASIEGFWQFMEQTYGKPTATERELPFCFTRENGQVVNGEMDLVYHTASGDVLVDYKTYQGRVADLTDEKSEFFAGKYSGQIALYEEALRRRGATLRDRLVCYISLGVAVRFE